MTFTTKEIGTGIDIRNSLIDQPKVYIDGSQFPYNGAFYSNNETNALEYGVPRNGGYNWEMYWLYKWNDTYIFDQEGERY